MKLKTTCVIIAVFALSLFFCGYHQVGEALAKEPGTFPDQQRGSGSVEQPVAPEQNPTGDIPDSQVFIRYASTAGGYELEVPEGWARTTKGRDVRFQEKLDGLSVRVTDGTPATAESVRKNQDALLIKSGRAVRIKRIRDIQLSRGPVVLVEFDTNSELDPVVNKQVRLENNSYFFSRNGKVAELRMWAPVGADNVDQWQLISNSFRWR